MNAYLGHAYYPFKADAVTEKIREKNKQKASGPSESKRKQIRNKRKKL